MSDQWGDPSNTTYRKNHIREAKQGEARANVHAVLRALTEDLWAAWDEAGVDLRVVQSGDDPHGLDFRVNVDLLDESALSAADSRGFTQQGRVFRFAGSYDWAKAKGDELQKRDMAELEHSFTPVPVEGDRPGSREFGRGDSGLDVKTLQLFLGIEATGKFSADTAAALKTFQRVNGITASGRADEEFWAFVIPRVIRWKRMGEAGREIRLIQSALVAFGYQAEPVTGRYGMITNRAVYQLRVDKGIAGATKVDSLVWGALFDLQYKYR